MLSTSSRSLSISRVMQQFTRTLQYSAATHARVSPLVRKGGLTVTPHSPLGKNSYESLHSDILSWNHSRDGLGGGMGNFCSLVLGLGATSNNEMPSFRELHTITPSSTAELLVVSTQNQGFTASHEQEDNFTADETKKVPNSGEDLDNEVEDTDDDTDSDTEECLDELNDCPRDPEAEELEYDEECLELDDYNEEDFAAEEYEENECENDER